MIKFEKSWIKMKERLFLALGIALAVFLISFSSVHASGYLDVSKNGDWLIDGNSDYYGLNTTNLEMIVFDKTPINETGLIKATRNGKVIGAVLPFVLQKVTTKWYICPVWNLTGTTTFGNNNGLYELRRVNYTIPNEELLCFNYNNLADNFRQNFTIKEVAIESDSAFQQNKIKLNITLLNGSTVSDRGAGFALIPLDKKKFSKVLMNYSKRMNLNDTTYGDQSPSKVIEFLDENGITNSWKFDFLDLVANQTAEKVKYRQFNLNGQTFDTYSVYGYQWGSGNSWEIDPGLVDGLQGNLAINYGSRKIAYDQWYNDWVFLLDNETATAIAWDKCTQLKVNGTCSNRGNLFANDGTNIWQNISGATLIWRDGDATTDGTTCIRTGNNTWSCGAPGVGGTISKRDRVSYDTITSHNNTFFVTSIATIGANAAVDFHVSYDNAKSWQNMTGDPDGAFINGSFFGQTRIGFLSANRTIVIFFGHRTGTSVEFNATRCSWNLGVSGGRNDCLGGFQNWSTNVRIGNMTDSTLIDGMPTCTYSDTKMYCYAFNQSGIGGSTNITQFIYDPIPDVWTVSTIAYTLPTTGAPSEPALAVTAMPNKTHYDVIYMLYTNNTTITDDQLRMAYSTNSGLTWSFPNFNLTNDTQRDHNPALPLWANTSNSSAVSHQQVVYTWDRNPSGFQLWGGTLDNILPNETAPTINATFLWLTVGSDNTKVFLWGSNATNNTSTADTTPIVDVNFTDVEDATLSLAAFVNNSSVSGTNVNNNTRTNITFSALSDGYYALKVTANDSSNVGWNNTSESFVILIDTVSPNITNTSRFNYSTDAGINYINLSLNVTDLRFVHSDAFEIDGINFTNHTVSLGGRGANDAVYWYNYSNASNGNHTFKIYANDTTIDNNEATFGGSGTWVSFTEASGGVDTRGGGGGFINSQFLGNKTICGNDICESSENILTCSLDCGGSSVFPEQITDNSIFIVVGVGFALLVVYLYFQLKKKKDEVRMLW